MDPTARMRVLKQSLIFAALSQQELQMLAQLTTERRFSDGEFIFWEGDPSEWFYFVEQGRVKIVKHSASGRELIVAIFTPGEIIGEVAAFEGTPYPASAQAMGPTSVMGIRRQDLLAFWGQNPEVSLKVIRILGERLKQAHSRLRDLAGEKVEQRIASLLLMLSAKLGTTLPFTRQDIADMAGTTVETAIRVMSRFGKRKITRSSRGKIVILDETKLRLLSEGPPV